MLDKCFKNIMSDRTRPMPIVWQFSNSIKQFLNIHEPRWNRVRMNATLIKMIEERLRL